MHMFLRTGSPLAFAIRSILIFYNCFLALLLCHYTFLIWYRLPEIMALGHISAGSSSLAEAVIDAGALTALTVSIAHNPEESVKCAAAWAVGQVGRHGPLQAQAVTESGALLALTGLEVAPSSSPDLALKCSKAACSVISGLDSLPALDALLRM
jgi:hypothetical protein